MHKNESEKEFEAFKKDPKAYLEKSFLEFSEKHIWSSEHQRELIEAFNQGLKNG